MPYIGKSPVAGGFHKLDNLTASATATYALTLGSAAYYPESANQLLVSLNGVIQAPQDSFTVSGSNIVFDSALTASDSIDFIVALGDVIGVGSVTDGAITTAKLGNGAVTDAKIDTMAASKLTGVLPVANGGTGTGTVPIFRATMSANQSNSHNTTSVCQFDTVVVDTESDFNTSTYRWTPSVAGYYALHMSLRYQLNPSNSYVLQTIMRKNGSSNECAVTKSMAGGRNSDEYTLVSSCVSYANGSTDYFELYGYNWDYTSAGSVTFRNDAAQTVFSGYLINAQ